MPTKLLIVESPGKVKKLSQILGSDWLVKASMGHVRELASDGIDSLGFELEPGKVKCRFVPRGTRGKETIAQLKSAVQKVNTVYLATDDDREGETIAWHLQQALHLKQPQRVVYSEITAPAVKRAIAHPRLLNQNLVDAGLCRTVLDKLVGYKGSPLLWKLQNGAKSMGRVQSATLHILCDRQRQIEAFVPQDYWNVFVEYAEGFRAFYHGSDTPEAEATPDDATPANERSTPESTRVLSQAEANRLVQQAQAYPHHILSIEGKIVNRTPPPPFVTSSLQQAAGSRLKFSPEKTMQVAQSLYEAGHITYMRTDSIELSPEYCNAARQWLTDHDPDNVPKKVTNHRKVKGSQEAHEAIRPTDINRASAHLKLELSGDEFALYVLIWKRAIASQCQPARVRQTRILTRSGNISWQAKGQVIEFAGYSKYWNNLSADVELPLLQANQALTLAQAAHEQKQTQPPPRYSEPKLVQVMERQGIGRPSTYAPTILTLKERAYVDVVKGVLQPTALGLDVDRFLADALPDLLQSAFTAEMERSLDYIAAGQQNWQKYLTAWNETYFEPALLKAERILPQHLTNSPIPRSTKQLQLSRTRCPSCEKPLAKVPSSKVKKKYFLKCVEGCENVVLFWSERSKRWEAPQAKSDPSELAKPQLTDFSCPVCRKALERYDYQKEGQTKTLLRCSNPKARTDPKHKDVVYFQTEKGWWSPKFGELKPT
ncbi:MULTISPECIES: type I DNA topoisomerase [Leptolyngbya]|uniref:type I DNA topoisomerase n=1 Tax=Leptolyngbya TaxID=47251 RepID=UPI001682F864|nr:type I DNA topoisomerase [Leptolyngbya sp. FACHB-1624]MBD1855751.1 type I DNA topoisomerase [Leptolyngbya sp. FACHB-1624]